MKNWLQRLLARTGFYMGRLPRAWSLDYYLSRVLDQLTIREVIDVGAHVGEFGAQLRRLGYRGTIHSFEPEAESFATLAQRTAHDPSWHATRCGVGKEPGDMVLHVYAASDFTSALTPSSVGLRRFGSHLNEHGAVMVAVDRLDSLLPQPGGPYLLKTDTQGADLDVIEGASGILDSVAAIVIELSAIPTYEGQPTWDEAIRCLRNLRYDPVGLVPISRERDQLRVMEFDGVFVRREHHSLVT